MRVLRSPSHGEIIVKASRFIGQTHTLSSTEDVKKIVSTLREEHPGAAHVVWAFAFGAQGDIFGYSDDREPRGTAGRPVYEVLKGSGIVNCLVTVVRYFGGTKLGTGGLARAYSDAAKEVMEKAVSEEYVETSDLALQVEYSVYERITQLFEEFGGSIKDEEFGEQVYISGSVPSSRIEQLRSSIMDCTAGNAEFIT